MAPLLVVILILGLYLTGGRYISTENAYVRAGMVMVSANVSGEVAKVLVDENDVVGEGDILFKLDMEPFDLAVDSAQAALVDAQNEFEILKASLERQRRAYTAAIEVETYEAKELVRMTQLAKTNAISQARLEAQEHALEVARNMRATADADINKVIAQLGGAENVNVEHFPGVQRARAALKQAELARQYATVRAKVNGIVARIDLHPGEYVRAGSAAFSIVETGNMWIEANLKETQLAHVHEGERAVIVVDAYPGHKIYATVSGVSPASGSEYAILPPQNATGNWVKVVRRIPVRLEIDDDQDLPPLRAGMSVEAKIDTEETRTIGGLIAAVRR
jgi:membrane fusion protein (multidrug efflux system)